MRTLAESKALLDPEMSALLGRLMNVARVAVISGADWPQFEKQLMTQLPNNSNSSAKRMNPTSAPTGR